MFIFTQDGRTAINVANLIKIFVDDTRSRTGTLILFGYTTAEEYVVIYESSKEENVRDMFDIILDAIVEGKQVIDVPEYTKAMQ